MKRFISGLALVVIIIVTFGTIYAAVQQAQRSGANHPQIQMAKDAADELNRGNTPLLVAEKQVDMARSLSPFTIIYDKKGNVYMATGYLNGKVPKAPLSMLSAASGKEYSAETWEPQKDIRIAAVTVAAKDYYVLSGRSLAEVEKDEMRTLQTVVIGGIIVLIVLGAATVARMFVDEY